MQSRKGLPHPSSLPFDEGSESTETLKQGTAILSGPHPEFSHQLLDLSLSNLAQLAETLKKEEETQLKLITSILRRLNLRPSSVPILQPSLSHMAISFSRPSAEKPFWDSLTPILLQDNSFPSSANKGGFDLRLQIIFFSPFAQRQH